ncbi:MAG TPA: hypothetical protein VI589_00420, partial [Vicinamibacteria bacterium]
MDDLNALGDRVASRCGHRIHYGPCAFQEVKEGPMNTTRIFAVAMLIIASGLVQAQPPGIKRTDVLRNDLGVPGREVIQVRVDFAPGVA